MTTTTLLLVIDEAEVTLVERSRREGVRRSRFHIESDVSPFSALRAPLQEVSRRRGRVRVLVALGAHNCQMKSLFGFSDRATGDAVNAELEADPSAFFLGDARELLLSQAAVLDDNWYAAAVRRSEFASISELCVVAGLVLTGVVPLAAIGNAVNSDEAAIGALGGSPPPLLIDPDAKVRAARRIRRWRLGLLAATILVLLTGACGPWGAVAIETRRLERIASSLEEQSVDPSSAGARARERAAEQLLERIRPSQRAMSLQLGLILTALPAGAVLTRLDVDTARVQLFVLSPPDSALVEALAQRSGLRDVRLIGAIVPVLENGVAYNRYALELSSEPAARRSSVAVVRP